MLEANKYTVIQEKVNRGETLSSAEAMALLAAYDQATFEVRVDLGQIDHLYHKHQELLREREETLKMKSELEEVIERRVQLRTHELETRIREEESRATQSESSKKQLEETVDYYRSRVCDLTCRVADLSLSLEALIQAKGWVQRLLARRRSKQLLEKEMSG